MSFSECFAQRFVVETAFGERLFGEAVDVQWFGSSRGLSYYSLINLFLMFFFMIVGLFRSECVLPTFKRVSLGVWQVSIFMVAVSVTITGITRWTLFWAVVHSLSESFMIFTMSKAEWRISRRRTFAWCFWLFIGIWFLIDLTLALALDMDSSHFVVAFMGAPIDFTTFGFWTYTYFKGKVRIFPVLAFFFHIVYIILVFLNCAFPPWGRILGLALNTLAVFFGSLPANQTSWRFSEVINHLIESDLHMGETNDGGSNNNINNRKLLSGDPKDIEGEETQEMKNFE